MFCSETYFEMLTSFIFRSRTTVPLLKVKTILIGNSSPSESEASTEKKVLWDRNQVSAIFFAAYWLPEKKKKKTTEVKWGSVAENEKPKKSQVAEPMFNNAEQQQCMENLFHSLRFSACAPQNQKMNTLSQPSGQKIFTKASSLPSMY